MGKSYVTMEQLVCRVCGKKFDSGSILMNRNLREVFNHKTTTGYGICNDDQAKINDGFIALVAIDESKSGEHLPNGNINPENAWRTGEIAYLKRDVFDAICNIHVDASIPLVFVDPEVIRILERRVQHA